MATPDAEDADYNDGHRAFQQAFISRQILSFEEAKPILAEILTIQGTHPKFFRSSSALTHQKSADEYYPTT
jgi:hypothetical protein